MSCPATTRRVITMTTTDVRSSAIEALAGRIFSTGVGTAELCTVYLGIHLGLYRSLAASPATSAALAERTGCDERYVREWLTAQAVAGLVTAAGADPAKPRETDRAPGEFPGRRC